MSGAGFEYHAFVMPHWAYWGIVFFFPLIFLFFAKRRERADAALRAKDKISLTEEADAPPTPVAGWMPPGNRLTRVIDTVTHSVGVFASMWAVICVCYYTFEVISRYFFGAPTNWVHEGSFLMFGVMYTLGGGALYLIDGHVRVDLFYSKWSPRGKAASDIICSVLVYVFILGVLISGWIFWTQGLDRNLLPDWFAQGYNMDISQTEWQIAYWPIKFAIPFGAFLLALQGVSRFIKDVQKFRHFGEVEHVR